MVGRSGDLALRAVRGTVLLVLVLAACAWVAGVRAETGPPPTPDGARGYESPPHPSGASALLVPRLLLLPVRAAIQVGTFPVKTAAGVFAPSGLFDRMARAHERGLYLVPVPCVDPELGANVGLRAGHGNPFDRDGVVTYRLAYGGTKEQLYSLTVRSRDADLLPYRAGWGYKLLAKYEILPHQNYFGLGNLSARGTDTYHYLLEQYLYLGRLRYAPTRWMACDLTLAAHRNQLRSAANLGTGEQTLERRFAVEPDAPGFFIDPQNIQGEVALRLDRRDDRGQPHAGWTAEGFFGYANGTGSDLVNFVHYGGEGQGYVPLARAHTLVLRVAGEEVRTNDPYPIKLTERPSLGGPSTLRGYLPGRFTDNASAFGTAEYRYRLSPLITASLFADLGKVMPRLLDVDFTDLHRSFGASLDFARSDRFYFRLLGARSDEDLILTATLESAFDRRDRRER